MVKHRLGTQWPDGREVGWRCVRSAPCIRRRAAWVCQWFVLKTTGSGFLVWASKSPRRFLGLGLKTKKATVYRLRHKNDGRMKTARATHRDLVVCFTWKQVRLWCPSLASRLVEARHRWCTWHHHGGRVEIKLNTDESMQRLATLTLLF
jgi:hypothetical protein